MIDFEPLYTTPTVEAVGRFLERHYALATPLRSVLLSRGLNDVYLIETENSESCIFRLSGLRARGAADVATETGFLAHLDRCGVAVAAAIPARTGALFVRGRAGEGMREAVLFRALKGRAPEPASAADARANGATLAAIHNAAETFRPAAPRFRLDLDHLLRRPLARVLACGLVEDEARRARFEALAARTRATIEAAGDLTWTHCHGDCHGFNARIGPDGQAAFFDFDDGGPGFLAYDLSVFLWAKVSFKRRLFAMWDAFLQGYRDVRAISPQDLEAAQAFVIVRHVWLMGEYAGRLNQYGRDNMDWIADEIDFLERWETERLRDRLF